MRLNLLGGYYVARSPIANAQACVNLYPERNVKDSPTPTTHYQRPGRRPIGFPQAQAPGRGVFRASNGQGYAVVGQTVYAVGALANGQLAMDQIGALAVPGASPCSFSDNGITGILVDGTSEGYTINLSNNGFAPIVDPTGTFVGARKVDYLDTFNLWAPVVPGGNQFGSTLSNEILFDALYTAGKTDYPDPIQTLIVNRHELLLIGELKTEAWYDAGNTGFPFAELPGAYFEHGTCAPYSVASADISVFFLGQDLQGIGFVFRIRGYECKRVSNHAVEFAIRKIAQQSLVNGIGITDAIGYTRTQDGHVFYSLTFPSGDLTLEYDDTTEEWFQSAFTDPEGISHRDRCCFYAFLGNPGLPIGQDWQFGTLYLLDPTSYTDLVSGTSYPITFLRTFPHMMGGEISLGAAGLDRSVESDGKMIQFKRFQADITTGTGPAPAGGAFTLNWSTDRGNTFESTELAPGGTPGDYATPPLWAALGMARDMVFQLTWNFPGEVALNGAWVDATVGTS